MYFNNNFYKILWICFGTLQTRLSRLSCFCFICSSFTIPSIKYRNEISEFINYNLPSALVHLVQVAAVSYLSFSPQLSIEPTVRQSGIQSFSHCDCCHSLPSCMRRTQCAARYNDNGAELIFAWHLRLIVIHQAKGLSLVCRCLLSAKIGRARQSLPFAFDFCL